METTVVTNETGDYRIDNVPPGPAELTFKLINFTIVRRTLNVTAGQTVTADAVLGLSLTADIVVTGTRTFRNIADLENPAENLVGIASAASQGAITARQLEARPIMRPAEVLEAVPGLIASQHSGEGKANQVLLARLQPRSRFGFCGHHRRRTGQPADSGALPWVCRHEHPDSRAGERRAVQEGPVLRRRWRLLGRGILERQLREPARSSDRLAQRWRPGMGTAFGAASPRIGNGHLLLGVEAVHNDGPWTRGDDFRKVNGIVRYSGETRAMDCPSLAWGTARTGTPPIRFLSVRSMSGVSPASAISIRVMAAVPKVQPGGRRPAVQCECLHARDSIRIPLRPESPVELHLLSRRSGERRPAGAGRSPHHLRWSRHVPAAGPFFRSPHRKWRGRAAAARRDRQHRVV